MKKLIATGAALVVLAGAAAAAPADAPAASSAKSGDQELGLGIVLGDPIGGTAKLWLNQTFAVDGGAGFASAANRTAIWADALWHDWSLLPQPKPGKLGAYAGAGPQLDFGTDPRFGVRAIVGASYRPEGHPIEFFAEIGPLFRFTQGGHVDVVGGVGVRVNLPTR